MTLEYRLVRNSDRIHSRRRAEPSGASPPPQANTDEVTSIPEKPAPNHATPRRTSFRRRLLWASAIAVVLALLGLFLATRSFVLESIARPHIVATVGGDIDIGRVRWAGWAQLEITDLSVRAPGWSGASGEVIRIDRALIKLDPSALRQGSFNVDRVEVEGMMVRIAEDAADPASFNILALRPELGGGGSPPARIDVHDLELQMGIDREGEWERKGSVQLAGDLLAAENRPRVFIFQFVTRPDGDRPRSVLKGELDTSSLAFNASIDDLQVDSNLLGMMPMELRRAAQSMNLKGHVQRLETAWDGARDLYAAIDLAEAELTVPNPGAESAWSRLDAGVITSSAQPPVMYVTSGQIALIDDRITLEGFEGRFTSIHPDTDEIPVRLDFQMDLAPVLEQRLDWSRSREFAAQVFRIAPFSLKLTVPNFEIRADSEGIVLPTAAARTIAQFGIEEWLLDINAHLLRGLPEKSAEGQLQPAPVHTTGTVLVANGVGRYSRFPFPLENVRAYIEFDDRSVRINYLIGQGPNGGSVTADGIIIDPGPAAEIDVHLLGQAVPADDVFRSALEGWRLRTWDRFFDKGAEELMRGADLLPVAADIEDARRERTELLKRLGGEEPLSDEEQVALQGRAARLQRVIRAGPFELGGAFDFDLTVSSPAGIGMPVDLTGTISIIEGDVLLSDFPLPVHVLESTIDLEADKILLGEGITFTTPWGGSGLIRGSIQTGSEDDDTLMKPDITYAAIDVSVSPTLLAALPPSGEDEPPGPDEWPGHWHSEAATALQALGIRGLVDLEGRWFSEDIGVDPQLSFDAKFRNGSIQPNIQLTEFFAEAGFQWPEGFALSDCTANIHLDPTIVRMTDFNGHRLDGNVTADGFISREGEEQALHVAFRSIQLEEYLLDLVPEGPQERARSLWDQFRPRGTFDADLDWSRDARGQRRSLVVARPHEVVLHMDGTDVTIERQQGEIRIKPDEITMGDMLLLLHTPGLTHGTVLLDGSYGRTGPEGELVLVGEVEDGHFESPVLTVLLDLFGAHRVRNTWMELKPSGRFDSIFEYRVLANSDPDYVIDLVPTSLSATIDEDRIHAAFDDGSIFITPRRIDMERLVARVPAPGILEIDGTVGIGEQIELLLAASYDLDALHESTHAYFPVPLSNGFESVDFTTDGRFQLTDLTISGTWDLDASINEPELYEFDGWIEFEDAKFVAGTDFDRFDGAARITLRAEPDESDDLRVHLVAPIHGESVDAQLRHIESPSAIIRIDGDDILSVNDLEGNLAGGRIVGAVEIDMARRSWEFELDLEDASLQELSRGRDEPVAVGTIGRVLANIHLFGLIDDPASKRGRGRIIIEEGEMTNSPLTLSIVQLSQLMLPMSDSLEFAEIAFTVEGDRMVFDEFLLTSPTIEFIGSGEMSMGDWELALRLAPKGTVPILSDLIGGVTGTLFAINISGTLGSPNATIEPLPVLGSPATIDDPTSQQQERSRQDSSRSSAGSSG